MFYLVLYFLLTTFIFGDSFAKLTDEQIILNTLREKLKNDTSLHFNNQNINVYIKFYLDQIIDIDERQQILTTSVIIDQVWYQTKINWENTQYLNTSVNSIRMETLNSWLPDTYIYNNAADKESGFLIGDHLIVYKSGKIHFRLRRKLKTFCPMDISMFPFDSQACIIKMGSWVHNGINYTYPKDINGSYLLNLDSYTDNSDWILSEAHIHHHPYVHTELTTLDENHLPGGIFSNKKQHPKIINIVLVLRRRSFFYIWILIVPFVMLTLLSILTFCMPSTSNEKLTISLSIFMAFSMFMIMISERIPPATQNVPLIAIYLSTIMTMAASSICTTVVIINIYQRKGYVGPSRWIRQLIVFRMAKWFNIRYTKLSKGSLRVQCQSQINRTNTNLPTEEEFNLLSILQKSLGLGNKILPNIFPALQIKNNNSLMNSFNSAEHMEFQEHPVRRNSVSSNRMVSSRKSDLQLEQLRKVTSDFKKNKLEWEIIATVLDNLFFYIFVVIYICIYIVIFFTPFIFKRMNKKTF